MEDILTRMGDGQRITMPPSRVKEELLAGNRDAADRSKVPELISSDLEQLFEIIADRNRVVTVEPGKEVVFTDDVSCVRHIGDEGAAGGVGIPITRLQAILVHECSYAQDSAVFQVPYGSGGNIQRVKEKIEIDMQAHETVSMLATVPMFYTKETVAVSDIPVHVNAGMGVCSVPMHPTPPIDCVSRMAKAMVHVARIDGL